MFKKIARISGCVALLICGGCPATSGGAVSNWVLVDRFERQSKLTDWIKIDAQNETQPYVADPQVATIERDAASDNAFMLRKPAADGIVGNRKAIGVKRLPMPIPVGATATLHARINVESFPNNQSFGLTNAAPGDIPDLAYDALEPMIRITDKAESNGDKNDGTLMVLSGYKTYRKITNPSTGGAARPLSTDQWYELWCVINNATADAGGQRYDLYVRGGEFENQRLVAKDALFRMQRGQPLTHFMMISNTGPQDKPYGNGGVRYDDIYLSTGTLLSSPIR
ncbi:MAG: hypothetical protein AB8G17_01470 [Gammaproteobacteria bacterium]